MFANYTYYQILPFLISGLIFIVSIIFFQIDKRRIALLLLFVGALSIGYFMANLNHFLMIWDEQYHALVAKHMLENPFQPTLYSAPLLNYNFRIWNSNHIWLHKQPLFLWQIALSLKIFGLNELSVRIPSIILHAFTAIIIYRIGKISYSDRVGFVGALFFSVAHYPLELIAGKYSTDHNDIAFLFYVTASFWAWFEYQHSQKKYWLILIGLFSGCAVLVKWLVGMLIYAVWIITIGINDKSNWLKLKSYTALLISITISLIVFMPWQLYIFSKFPNEALFEFQYNSKHFVDVVENHGGSIWFHYTALKNLYGSGDAVPFLFLIGLFILIKNSTKKLYKAVIISAVIITYTFYTIAASKMTSYCIIVSPFFFLGFAAQIDITINFLKTKLVFSKFELIFRPVVIIIICFFLMDFPRITDSHIAYKAKDNSLIKIKSQEMILIKKLTYILKEEKYVIFNTSIQVEGNIPIMFYTNYIAYPYIPTKEDIEIIKNKSYKIAILDLGNLPQFIIGDKEILKIKIE